MMQTKKSPMRKCIACNEMREKKQLIRIVKTTDGTFQVDKTGKLNGRGAYICNNKECFLKAKKSKGLERSFKTSIDEEVYQMLEEEFEVDK